MGSSCLMRTEFLFGERKGFWRWMEGRREGWIEGRKEERKEAGTEGRKEGGRREGGRREREEGREGGGKEGRGGTERSLKQTVVETPPQSFCSSDIQIGLRKSPEAG